MKGADQYHVKVSFNFRSETFYVNPDDTIESFKTKVASRIKLTRFHLSRRLFLLDSGGLDQDSCTLKRCGIENGQVLFVHPVNVYNLPSEK